MWGTNKLCMCLSVEFLSFINPLMFEKKIFNLYISKWFTHLKLACENSFKINAVLVFFFSCFAFQ